MAVDWALHNKPGNPHVHVMCTVRGFNRDRSWARMEKKVIALDADGNRIPVIDPKTEKQKVRARKGKEWEKNSGDIKMFSPTTGTQSRNFWSSAETGRRNATAIFRTEGAIK